jgi:hypothetical protein
MSFEVLSRKNRVFVGTPAISLTKLGRLAFNTTASVQLKENKAEKVLLLWDKETKRIGVQVITTKEDDRAYKIHWSPRGDGCGFTASTALKQIGFDTSETRSMPVKWDEQERMFIIEVPEKYLKKDGSIMVRTKGHAITPNTSKIEDVKSNEDLVCKVCGKPCKSPFGLRNHIRLAHPTKETNN